MTIARELLVDPSVTRYYHCISRCVRRAFLCGEGFEHRKQWIEDRLELLSGSFAVSVCGFAVLDNHLHVLVRLDPDLASGWSDEEVVRRWLQVYPPKALRDAEPKLVNAWVKQQMKDAKKVATMRERLKKLGWFMKALKEPLARMANREDGCKGTFWEGRYKSIAILDTEALLATCVYIDLNVVAAGKAATPETSPHTSIRQRVLHAKSAGVLDGLKAAAAGSVSGSRAIGRFEQAHWLCPLEDRRPSGPDGRSRREGMLEGFSLGSYLLLVDYSSRLQRAGKARVNRNLMGILERLGTSTDVWNDRLRQLFGKRQLLGSYFATDRQRLRNLATARKAHHLDNLITLPESRLAG
jgi:hypothetical protein